MTRPPRRDTRRRIEQLAHNPRCAANALSVAHDIPMPDVAAHLGLPSRFGQSRFAITRGLAFEKRLFADDAEALREALVRSRVLPVGSEGFLDLRLTLAGGRVSSLDVAHRHTLALFERLDREGPFEGMPCLVAGATLRVPGDALLPDGMVALDLLALHVEGRQIALSIGEIKVYPDRGGHTDAHQLATARAQAGLYLHLLRTTLAEHRVALDARDHGFLVLTRAGQNTPSIRAREDLRFQARRAEVALAQLRDAVSSAPKLDSDERRHLAVVEAPKHYGEGCVAFCDLADHCLDEALDCGSPAALGDEARRALGTVSIPRALELLKGDSPTHDAERDLLRRLGGPR